MEVAGQRNGFTIVIDSREQRAWSFEGITKQVRGVATPLEIPTVVKGLSEGDYSILGMEDKVCIERKSAQDLVSTIAHSRKRFERELKRMQEMKFSCVVIESDWASTQTYCAECTGFNPVSLDSSILAWQQRYIKTHWLYRPDRFAAAKTCWKVLDRFFKEHKS